MITRKVKTIIHNFTITLLTTTILTISLANYEMVLATENSNLISVDSVIGDVVSHDFTVNGTNSDFFNIKGSLSTKKGSIEYNGLTLTQCLKINRSSEIKFTTTTDAKLTLVFNSNFNKKIEIDGIKEKAENGMITVELKPGAHTIEKSNTANLYYIELSNSKAISEGSIDIESSNSMNSNSSTNSADAGAGVSLELGDLKTTGTYTNLINMEDNEFVSAIYVSPNGAASNDGSLKKPLDLTTALKKVSNDESSTILLLSGTYEYSSQVNIDSSGSENSYNVLKAAKGASVVFDFSGQVYNSTDTSKNSRGIQLNGSYWYIGGVTIKGAADNGMLLAGSHNIIERCIFYENRDTGLQISRKSSSVEKENWPSFNKIINCTSKNNCDPSTFENADGFAAKLTVGEGNVFDGCISYNNSDDGWDLYAKKDTGAIGVVTIRNSIAMRNGKTEDGTTKDSCDGNGFKLGGSGIGTPHIITNSIAIENLHHGFTDNNNPSALQVTNCTAFDNNLAEGKNNFSLYRCKDAVVSNVISYTTNETEDKFMNLKASYLIYSAKNSWYKVFEGASLDTTSSSDNEKILEGIKASDFLSTSIPKVGTDFDKVWRNTDGTINTQGSALVSSSSSFSKFSTDGGVIGARFNKDNNVSITLIKVK